MKKIYIWLALLCCTDILMAQTSLQLLENAFEQQSDSLFKVFIAPWKYNAQKDTTVFTQTFTTEQQKSLLSIVEHCLYESIYNTTDHSAHYIIIPSKIAVMTEAEQLPPNTRYNAKEKIRLISTESLNLPRVWRKATLNRKATIISGDTLLVNTLGDFVKQSVSDSIKQQKMLFLKHKIPIYQLYSSNIYRDFLADEHFYANIYGNNGLFLPYNLPFIALIEINDKWNKAYINLNDSNLKPYTLSFTKKKGKWLRKF